MLPCASLQCVHACLLGRWQGLCLVQSRPADGPPPAHKPTGRWGCPRCSCPTPGTCCTPPASHRPAEAAGLLSESQQVLHLTGRQQLWLEGSPWPCSAARMAGPGVGLHPSLLSCTALRAGGMSGPVSLSGARCSHLPFFAREPRQRLSSHTAKRRVAAVVSPGSCLCAGRSQCGQPPSQHLSKQCSQSARVSPGPCVQTNRPHEMVGKTSGM